MTAKLLTKDSVKEFSVILATLLHLRKKNVQTNVKNFKS